MGTFATSDLLVASLRNVGVEDLNLEDVFSFESRCLFFESGLDYRVFWVFSRLLALNRTERTVGL